MIYRVTRTSVWDYEEKPCDEAFKGETMNVWYNQPRKETYWWFVKLDTLEDLHNFIRKYGKVVIQEREAEYPEHPFEIEIYDDYRE